MEIGDILQALPERYPLLLVDRILELEAGARAVGLKNVTINEEFFRGHFPDQPVMPGVLILEALAQVGRLVLGAEGGRAVRIDSVQKARFRKPVVPGDSLRLEVEVEPADDGWILRGRALVDDARVAEATLHAVPEEGSR
jgi:beta-hydroxyacyl-ACP dehydratase FabZ